jgi:hypothetical protein
MKRLSQSLVFSKHFKTLFHIYGKQIAINLINKTGYESRYQKMLISSLGDEFLRQTNLFGRDELVYIHFDFHQECRKMQWHRISILIDALRNELDEQGFLSNLTHSFFVYSNASKTILAKQASVIRTNCMDCLDR